MKRTMVYSLLLLMSTMCSASQLSFTTQVARANCTEDVGGVITVIVQGGVGPYLVEVTGQENQVEDNPVFRFPDLAAGDYLVEVTDSGDPEEQRVLREVLLLS